MDPEKTRISPCRQRSGRESKGEAIGEAERIRVTRTVLAIVKVPPRTISLCVAKIDKQESRPLATP